MSAPRTLRDVGRMILWRVLAIGVWCILSIPADAADPIPHHQDKPPGPPLSPEEAVKKMTVPAGFRVELVAAEPDLVNPVAMTFDERGRIWVTESVEYPRKSPGPGQDRVKILEDTDSDGRVDKVGTFLDGLNIPSGVAVGHGGVWIANSPDILFVPDADRDGKPDGPAQVVVTGFGRTDTHELPNSLTWGPDGWLYGLNGVFNHSHVRYPKDNPNFKEGHPGWKFTCAMFRIHPRTREFQIFAEGTSNPWGIAINENGDFFISACVIDHLWHIVETGYYQRQGGPYPPHTWPMGSIVKHKHQKAAYCGITWFDSDAYPEAYRRKLYMGNIHGGCLNVDKLARDGSTYTATPEPDFLTANDAWFMPVAQKTGPDGCLYVLDWYDRYHCYQDANRDPAGIERLKGRLYRVRYIDSSDTTLGIQVRNALQLNHIRYPKIDLSAESDRELIDRLDHPNIWVRETAQRILQERWSLELAETLSKVVEDNGASVTKRRHALFALANERVAESFQIVRALSEPIGDPVIKAWGARLLSHDPRMRKLSSDAVARVDWRHHSVEHPSVRLQRIVGLSKLTFNESVLEGYLWHLSQAGDDRIIPQIVWQNLHPRLDDHSTALVTMLQKSGYLDSRPVIDMMPRIIDRLLSRMDGDYSNVATLFQILAQRNKSHLTAAKLCLVSIAQRVQSGEIQARSLHALKEKLSPDLTKILEGDAESPLHFPAAILATSWKDPAGVESVRKAAMSAKSSTADRLAGLDALIAAKNDKALPTAAIMLSHLPGNTPELRGQVLASLGRLDDSTVGLTVVAAYPTMEPDLQPKAVELLTQRAAWAKSLLAAIRDKKIPQNALNENQVRRLLAIKDAELAKAVESTWGKIREGRNPQREQVIAEMKQFVRKHPGDAPKGREVFKKVCGQCHKMYGEGAEVGPDITLNGRNNYDQLLSNVFDPSLVIGASYQARILATTDGRVLTGLPVEESDQRVVLKVQGGKLETIPRSDIEELKISPLSMMPENLETQLKPEELANLFAYITLDRPPEEENARRLPGVYEVVPRQTTNPAEFNEILSEVAPGFRTNASGDGVVLLATHMGRDAVVRTHPPERGKPCVLTGDFEIPADRKTHLLLSVSHDARGDWQLVVKVDGESLLDTSVDPKSTTGGWAEHRLDLSRFAGKKVKIELHNQPSGWSYESAFWGRAAVLSE
ncbi:MAG: c-type cytochrome [Planctomycetaceae bacterium]|nr:c-type cytochrome [Planctomycetaceae bacterium]